jgi:hypothetical protein
MPNNMMYGGILNRGTQKWMVHTEKSIIKIDDLGVPPF